VLSVAQNPGAIGAKFQPLRKTDRRQEATAALAAICARYADGNVKSPDGLLRCMVELHGKGTLRLDRTLFGLAAKLSDDHHQKSRADNKKMI